MPTTRIVYPRRNRALLREFTDAGPLRESTEDRSLPGGTEDRPRAKPEVETADYTGWTREARLLG